MAGEGKWLKNCANYDFVCIIALETAKKISKFFTSVL